jgi:hypothetical protein
MSDEFCTGKNEGERMSANQYAAKTTVSVTKSKEEIEKTLRRYGASQFAYGYDQSQAVVGFKMRDRQVKFTLPLPDINGKKITHTPVQGNRRSTREIERAYEQATRQKWRALALVIKAKLESVESGIVTFEDEFAMHFILPNGKTVRDHIMPEIEHAYATGQVKPMLAIGSGA